MTEAQLLVFILTSLAVIITPGQDMILVKAPAGYFSGSFSSWLRSRPLALKWLDRASGVVLIGLGVKLAFEQRN